KPLRRRKRREQSLRRDKIPDAQGGKYSTRERPDVDHPALPVQSLQRLERLPFIAELAIVVILHDYRSPALGPLQKLQAPGQREDGAGGKLVGWSHEGEAGLRRQPGGIQSFAIHLYRQQTRAGGTQDLPRALVTRVFDGDLIAALDQYPGDQVEG